MSIDVKAQDAADLLDTEKMNLWRRITRVQAAQIVMVLIAICIVFSVMAPEAFPTVFNLRSIIVNTSIFAVLGVGATLVIITAGIDLSIGSVLIFSSVVAAKVMGNMGATGWGTALVGVVVATSCGAAWGFVNGFLIAKAKVPAFIVTLGTLGMALGFAQVLTGGIDLTDVPEVFVDVVGFGNVFWEVPTLTVVAAVVVILGSILLHRTRFGLYTFAVGSNPEACRRTGIKVDRQLIWVYVICGACAGFAGILSLAFYQQTTIGGQSMTALTVVAGVVIGGTSLFGGLGSIFGTVIGLLIPVVLEAGFIIIGVESYWQGVVVGIFLIGAVYLDGLRRNRLPKGSGRKPSHRQIGDGNVGKTEKDG
jgi:ribose transport system permease protein